MARDDGDSPARSSRMAARYSRSAKAGHAGYHGYKRKRVSKVHFADGHLGTVACSTCDNGYEQERAR